MVGLAHGTVGAMMCRPNDLALRNFYKMLDALGYEVVIRSKDERDTVEWKLKDEDEPIEAELYAPDIPEIISDNKPPAGVHSGRLPERKIKDNGMNEQVRQAEVDAIRASMKPPAAK